MNVKHQESQTDTSFTCWERTESRSERSLSVEAVETSDRAAGKGEWSLKDKVWTFIFGISLKRTHVTVARIIVESLTVYKYCRCFLSSKNYSVLYKFCTKSPYNLFTYLLILADTTSSVIMYPVAKGEIILCTIVHILMVMNFGVHDKI